MQFPTITLIATALLALGASAAPAVAERNDCTFGVYRCTANSAAIEQCGLGNQWLKIGDCPYNTHCAPIAGIPYCVANGN